MLSSAAVTAYAVENSVEALIMEWLGIWFNGGPQTIAGTTLTFPKVDLAWGSGPPLQPMQDQGNGVEIRVLMLPRQEVLDGESIENSRYIIDRVLFQFFVKGKTQGKGQSALLVRNVGDLLGLILRNPDPRFDLNLKGIMAIRPLPAMDLTSKDFSQRLVPCSAQLHYHLTFNGVAAGQPYDEQIAVFTRELAFVTGEYFIGGYAFQNRMKATSAQIFGFEPQGTPAVATLEVAGMLTAFSLTLPAGAALTEGAASVDLTGLPVITPGQMVRWKITSGPSDQTLQAWKSGITMNVHPI